MAKASLPRPLEVGCTTVRVAAAAMAASTALPPFFRISRPAWEARDWAVLTMPRLAKVTIRREG